MSRYKLGKPGSTVQNSQNRGRVFVRSFFIALILLIPVAIYIIWTTRQPDPVTGRTIDKGYFDPFTTIETEYFSFRVEKTWEAVPEITKEGKVYFYREMQAANPQGLLAIFINSRPVGSEDFYSNVLPVSVVDGHQLNATKIEEHCDKAANPVIAVNHRAEQGGASFTCWAGAMVMYAVASEIDGDDNEAGKWRQYRFHYYLP